MLSPQVKVWLTAALALLSGYMLSQARQYAVRPPLVLGQDAVSDQASTQARVSLENVGGPVIHILPPVQRGRVLLVFYGGGLVRPQAYEWLGRALSAKNIETVIPAFPADLAVTQQGRAAALIAKYAQGRPVVLAGHSLGGAMAAQYAGKNPAQISGLILMAAYPPKNTDLTAAKFPVLSLLAEHDGVASPADVRGGLARLPSNTELKVVSGSVHSFFGRYGPQKGDGVPSVSRQQAEDQILKDVEAFVAQVQ